MMKIEILMKLIKIKNLIMIMMKLKTLIKMQKKWSFKEKQKDKCLNFLKIP